MTDITARMEELTAHVRRRKEEIRLENQKVLDQIVAEGFGTILAKYDFVHSFYWKQYVPYFNDGDELVFSVDGLMFTVKDEDDFDDYGHETSYVSVNDDERFTPGFVSEVKALNKMLSSFDEDTLREVYGDHSRITINMDEAEEGRVTVTVESYSDHD